LSSIESHIASLLEEKSCVIIPAFGGFLIQHKPAFFVEAHQQFHPPSAQIGFNKNLDGNDGLLINRLANEAGISYSEAQNKIQEFVADANKSLEQNRSVIIKGIGKLFIDAEDNIQFAQHGKDNLRVESFGLPVLESHLIPQPLRTVENKPVVAKKEKILPYRIAAVLALLLTLSLLGILQSDSVKQNTLDQVASVGSFEVELGESS